jgi:N6-L-threonylcarbamoyladenine synthase
MLILGIETSCDDTAAAVVQDGTRVLSNCVSSQDEIHGPYGGVVPELASRQHILTLIPIIEEALNRARIQLGEIDAIAATRGPGLVGSLLVGLNTAKAIAFEKKIPFVGVNHLEGHLLSIFLDRNMGFPFLSLLVSGGHTLLYEVNDFGQYRYLGGTRDDAAGEAYDKAAKILGLSFPGGPVIDRLAQGGNPEAVRFPRARLKNGSLGFSFSGLKTSLWQFAREKSPAQIQDNLSNIAASFQEAIVDMLVETTTRAAAELSHTRIVVSGGVSANRGLRKKLTDRCKREGREAFFPSPKFCTDNAAMIALAGYQRFKAGDTDSLDLNADPDLKL